MFAPIPSAVVKREVARGLAEDIGDVGDVTSVACLPPNLCVCAVIVANASGVLSGAEVAREVFRQVDPQIDVKIEIEDGAALSEGDIFLRLKGDARALFAGERVALNFLARMSGVATTTSHFVKAIGSMKVRMLDTRKTTPGLRVFDKYAVRCGGGKNHRFSLFDSILVKDNHIKAAGGIRAVLKRLKARANVAARVEIEVDSFEQLEDVLEEGGVDVVLLDNMSVNALKDAVRRVDGRVMLEASGGVTLENVQAIAETGVDFISSGFLTQSAPALDVSMDVL